MLNIYIFCSRITKLKINKKPERYASGFSTYVIFYPALAKTFG